MGLIVVCRLGAGHLLPAVEAAEVKPFAIQVLDAQTGRGVPLVELETVHHVRYLTDSNGLVALDEPGLMGQRVFFFVRSHGYEFPRDGFGYAGKALQVTPGGKATLTIRRKNIAQRLYRVIGQGIYRDSVRLGHSVPIHEPLLNGKVLGSDSVLNTVYRGKVYWFWGDTNWPAYPLGNFHTPGATSLLPSAGGLDPKLGVDLAYFLDEQGRAKPTAPMPGDGPTWLSGLTVLRDASGAEHLGAAYVKIKPPMNVYRRGLVEFDDKAQQFKHLADLPLDVPACPRGHPLEHSVGGVPYVYFADPYPLVRVKAAWNQWRDCSHYETFTCLKEGSRQQNLQLDRKPDGSLRYAWKRNTPPMGIDEQVELIKSGKLKPGEALMQLCNPESGKPLKPGSGSVYWNPYRRRWIMIMTRAWGETSMLGETWYAEADSPLGPWVYGVMILSHDNYSFYNPKQHPMFDADEGRTIYFEGTYTMTFSGNKTGTPWYDYTQIMYSLDLTDPRLAVPVPIYRLASSKLPCQFGVRQEQGPPEGATLAFFAPDRPREGCVPILAAKTSKDQPCLIAGQATDKAQPSAVFYALPAEAAEKVKAGPAATKTAKEATTTLCPLYEFADAADRRAYSTDANWSSPGLRRLPQPLCRVWISPLSITLPAE